jgi:hypothetical protein
VFSFYSKDEITDFFNLKESISIHALGIYANLIACIASDKIDTYNFFFCLVPRTIEIKYFETIDLSCLKEFFFV